MPVQEIKKKRKKRRRSSCRCGADCPVCDRCETPKCECYCNPYEQEEIYEN